MPEPGSTPEGRSADDVKPTGVQSSVPLGDGTAQRLHPESSEADYLTQQAEDAKAAIARTFTAIAQGLGQGVNPLQWARQYPWATLGASAVAGFVAASLLIPSKEDQALRKLAAIERALNPPPPRPSRKERDEDEKSDDLSVDGRSAAKDYKSGRAGVM